jgi:uncharacterized metal-binding protein
MARIAQIVVVFHVRVAHLNDSVTVELEIAGHDADVLCIVAVAEGMCRQIYVFAAN